MALMGPLHFHIPSVQHKRATLKTPQFNNPLSSTHPAVPHPPHFNTPRHDHPLSSISKSLQFNRLTFFGVEMRGVSNWGGCWTERGVELRGLLNRWFFCWTEGYWGLKRSGPCMLNWKGCETQGDLFLRPENKILSIFEILFFIN